MIKYSVCIDMMFANLDFYDRFEAVKRSGIDTVEFWKWSVKDIDRIIDIKNRLGMDISIFNIDCANEKLSADLSRGILNAGRTDEFLSALKESIPVYKKLNASGMIVLIGETLDITYDEQMENIYNVLKAAAPIAEENGITLLVEPLNATDRKNYFMPYSAPVFDILSRIGSPNVKMLFDIYHQQMTEGHVTKSILENTDLIGHFHVADCPGRHEPGTGELNYPNIIRAISQTDYPGYIGLEYRATMPDSETLGFME